MTTTTRRHVHEPAATAAPRRRRPRGLGVLAVAGVVATALVLLVVAWARDVTTAGERLVGAGSVRTAEHGYVPGDAPLSVFDDEAPALARLDPDLRAALRRAAADAAAADVRMYVTSGWRSPEYQQHLLDAAVEEYGSLAAARRRVSTPELSKHVTGDAVDVGPTAADYWLIEHGHEYGLCQTYANEIWHFELATTPGGTCPPMLPDAAS